MGAHHSHSTGLDETETFEFADNESEKAHGHSATPHIPPTTKGKQMICVAGYAWSPQYDRVKAIVHALTHEFPAKYEAFFFETSYINNFLQIRRKLSGDASQLHDRLPLCWLQNDDGTTKIIGGRNRLAAWVLKNEKASKAALEAVFLEITDGLRHAAPSPTLHHMYAHHPDGHDHKDAKITDKKDNKDDEGEKELDVESDSEAESAGSDHHSRKRHGHGGDNKENEDDPDDNADEQTPEIYRKILELITAKKPSPMMPKANEVDPDELNEEGDEAKKDAKKDLKQEAPKKEMAKKSIKPKKTSRTAKSSAAAKVAVEATSSGSASLASSEQSSVSESESDSRSDSQEKAQEKGKGKSSKKSAKGKDTASQEVSSLKSSMELDTDSDFELPRLPSKDDLLEADVQELQLTKSEKIRRRQANREAKELRHQLRHVAKKGPVKTTLEMIEEVQKKLAKDYPELEPPPHHKHTTIVVHPSKSDKTDKTETQKSDKKSTNSAAAVGNPKSDPPETSATTKAASSSPDTKKPVKEDAEEVKEKLIKSDKAAKLTTSSKGKEREKSSKEVTVAQ